MNKAIERKYRIRELIDSLPYSERRETINRLCQATGISYAMLRRIWAYKASESNEAKPSQLLAIAEFFEIDIYDLLSNVPAAQKS